MRVMNVRIRDGCQKLKVGMGKCSAARCARDGIGDLFCDVPSVMCRYVQTVGAIACDECYEEDNGGYDCGGVVTRNSRLSKCEKESVIIV